MWRANDSADPRLPPESSAMALSRESSGRELSSSLRDPGGISGRVHRQRIDSVTAMVTLLSDLPEQGSAQRTPGIDDANRATTAASPADILDGLLVGRRPPGLTIRHRRADGDMPFERPRQSRGVETAQGKPAVVDRYP
jgi:hypothetical protein